MKTLRTILGLPLGLALLIVTTCLFGCASTPVQPARPAFALLVIENQRTDAEWIYLERNGARGRHIATVEALSTDTLALRDSDLVPGMPFDLIAIAFGGNPAAADRSEDLIAEPGVVYRWTLRPMRGANDVTQRSAE